MGTGGGVYPVVAISLCNYYNRLLSSGSDVSAAIMSMEIAKSEYRSSFSYFLLKL